MAHIWHTKLNGISGTIQGKCQTLMENQAKRLNTTREEARKQFFRTINRVQPEVLRSLSNDVLPLYEAIYLSGIADVFEPSELPVSLLAGFTMRIENGFTLTYAGSLPFKDDVLEMFTQFQHAFSQWAMCWHLANQWCIERALLTLDMWLRSDTKEDFDWEYEGEVDFSLLNDEFDEPEAEIEIVERLTYPQHNDPLPDVEQINISLADQSYLVSWYEIDENILDDNKFHFKYPAWDIESDTWKSYRTKVENAFRIALKEYRNQVAEEARETNREVAIQKREDMHFTWLVEFQINELPVTKERGESIVNKYQGKGGLDQGTVSEAIHSVDVSSPLCKRSG